MKEAVSVSQLNKYIKELISYDNILRNVYVKGEVSNLKESRGNYYFSLKDDSSSIQCIVFTSYSGNSVDISSIRDGEEILVKGKVAVYEKGGSYSIYVAEVEKSGLGNYFIELEKLKKKLYELGMFDESYKKSIPTYSSHIGVVTAENGAAIKDIYVTIKNKNPYADVYLYPSLVQGDRAYESIVDGIMTLDKMGLDVIIIGRGGGSIEDLYAFNDERVAYAIFNARTPIISAVGHEINDTISDLVADLRVATPTAAGEASTFDYSEFVESLENYKLQLDDLIDEKIKNIQDSAKNFRNRIEFLSPRARIDRYKDKVESSKEKMRLLTQHKLDSIKTIRQKYIEIFRSRNVIDKMTNGFLYTTNSKDNKITSIKKVKVGDRIYSRTRDGVIESSVVGTTKMEV